MIIGLKAVALSTYIVYLDDDYSIIKKNSIYNVEMRSLKEYAVLLGDYWLVINSLEYSKMFDELPNQIESSSIY
jgi:hypothetical protein